MPRQLQMHDAMLHLRLGEDRRDRLGEADEAIDQRDEDVDHATTLELRHHPQPEACAFCLLDPQAEYVLPAVAFDP